MSADTQAPVICWGTSPPNVARVPVNAASAVRPCFRS